MQKEWREKGTKGKTEGEGLKRKQGKGGEKGRGGQKTGRRREERGMHSLFGIKLLLF